MLITALSPFFKSQLIDPTNNPTTELLAKTSEDKVSENRLYIPKIDINLPYQAGGEEVMEDGALWRQPQNGNPKDGGNFILSAHRFLMGFTPEGTWRKSPFYNIDKLEIGDKIVVDYEKERYTYIVKEKTTVSPESIEIENRTDKPRLTLYSCTLGGANDGRIVIIALPAN